MARSSAGTRGPRHYWRCPRCAVPVPSTYSTCANCGTDRNALIDTRTEDFIRRVKATFPGAREV